MLRTIMILLREVHEKQLVNEYTPKFGIFRVLICSIVLASDELCSTRLLEILLMLLTP